jgi:hypothetical protein
VCAKNLQGDDAAPAIVRVAVAVAVALAVVVAGPEVWIAHIRAFAHIVRSYVVSCVSCASTWLRAYRLLV